MWSYFKQVWDDLARELDKITEQAVVDFVDAFPNVFKMADVLFRWASNATGTPILVYFELLVGAIKRPGKSKVLTERDAFELQVASVREFVRFLAGRDEQGIIEFAVKTIARSVYTWTKKVYFFAAAWRLIGVNDLDGLIKLVYTKWLRGILFLVTTVTAGILCTLVLSLYLIYVSVYWESLSANWKLKQGDKFTKQPHRSKRRRV